MSRFRYTVHNIVGHPISEILWLLGFSKASRWFHDVTLPNGEDNE